METKKFNIILIILLMIAMLTIGLLLGYIFYGDKEDSTPILNDIVPNEDVSKLDENVVGKYTLTYKDAYESYANDYIPSTIEFKEDGTFEFVYNMCSSMNTMYGYYEVNGDEITLSNLDAYAYSDFEFHIGDKNTLLFKVINDNEIYFDWDDPYQEDMFACTHTGTKYSTFIK